MATLTIPNAFVTNTTVDPTKMNDNFTAVATAVNTNAGLDVPKSGGTMTGQLVSSLAIGTAPISVTSTTVCPNLNAAKVGGKAESEFATSAQGTTADAALPKAGGTMTGAIHSDVTTGTAPITVDSTTLCTNLNADKVDGLEATAFATAAQGTKADAALPATSQATDSHTVDGKHASEFATSAQGSTADAALAAADAVSTNTANKAVKRDASGNFAAGAITATFTGNLTGNVTGNTSGSSGSCTGNAATVTTNANLTGDVTSVGNATTIAKVSPHIITTTCHQDATSSTSFVVLYPSNLTWSSSLATGRSVYLEGYLYGIGVGNTITVDLYDATAGATVSGSEISKTASEGLVRSSALTLTNGHVYQVRQKSSGNSVTLYASRIYVL